MCPSQIFGHFQVESEKEAAHSSHQRYRSADIDPTQFVTQCPILDLVWQPDVNFCCNQHKAENQYGGLGGKGKGERFEYGRKHFSSDEVSEPACKKRIA